MRSVKMIIQDMHNTCHVLYLPYKTSDYYLTHKKQRNEVVGFYYYLFLQVSKSAWLILQIYTAQNHASLCRVKPILWLSVIEGNRELGRSSADLSRTNNEITWWGRESSLI